MNYVDFLNCVIDDGLAEVRLVYVHPKDKQKLDGAIKGFEDCRNLDPLVLSQLLNKSYEKMCPWKSNFQESEDYWYWRYYNLQIEFVCNVVSAMLHNEGKPIIIAPTYRGLMKAADIVGIKAS